MKKLTRITERYLTRILKKILRESAESPSMAGVDLTRDYNETNDSGNTTQTPKVKPKRRPIPSELKDRKGVENFQNWLDTYHSDAQDGPGKGWATGYTGGKVDKGKGYGRFGPRTERAWNKYKTEYLNQENKNQQQNNDYQLDQTADRTRGV